MDQIGGGSSPISSLGRATSQGLPPLITSRAYYYSPSNRKPRNVTEDTDNSITVPTGATFAVARVLGPGGNAGSSQTPLGPFTDDQGNSYYLYNFFGGGGGAFAKATLPVIGGETLTTRFQAPSGLTPGFTQLSRSSTVLVKAAGGRPGVSGSGYAYVNYYYNGSAQVLVRQAFADGRGGQAADCIGDIVRSGGDGGCVVDTGTPGDRSEYHNWPGNPHENYSYGHTAGTGNNGSRRMMLPFGNTDAAYPKWPSGTEGWGGMSAGDLGDLDTRFFGGVYVPGLSATEDFGQGGGNSRVSLSDNGRGGGVLIIDFYSEDPRG